MLKKNVKDFKKNVFDEIDNGWPILTAGDKFVGFNSMTVSWGGFGILWNKPVFYVFVRKSRNTYNYIEKSNSVTLSFLNEKYKDAKAYFGSKSGRDVDKFKECNLHATFEPDFNGYYVAESDYVFKGKKIYSVDLTFDQMPEVIKDKFYPTNDMHRMYVIEITHYLVKED